MIDTVDASAETGEANNGWRHTARPEWSSAGESMWMRLAKFSVCNRLSVTALAALFAIDRESATEIDLRRADWWKPQALAAALEIGADEIHASFCNAPLQTTLQHASRQLRYCTACLERGFHAAWFQWLLVERCPLHLLLLRLGCMRCTASIPYAVGQDLATHPLSCASCGCAWVPSLSRPAGKCVPLDRRSSRLLRRWTNYVEHAVADECHRPREQQSGRFLSTLGSSPSARPHHLTMANRLFDAPPPLTAQLLRRRPWNRRPSLVPAAAGRPGFSYDPSMWPHFNRHFETCEYVLRDAYRQLFAAVHDECVRGRWQHLLSADLAAPCRTMDCDTAAALGWIIAWTSPVQALAPEAGRSMPALGLAGWLASLPLRRPGMPKHRWHSQVLKWLREDLESSASIWRSVAGFMRAKGVYLLHGSVAHPRELARHRCYNAPAVSCLLQITRKSLPENNFLPIASHEPSVVATFLAKAG